MTAATAVVAVAAVSGAGTAGVSVRSGASFRCGAGTAATAGACSMIACALVPLMPNDDTPARRGLPVSGHGVGSVSRRTAPPDQSTCGFGVPA